MQPVSITHLIYQSDIWRIGVREYGAAAFSSGIHLPGLSGQSCAGWCSRDKNNNSLGVPLLIAAWPAMVTAGFVCSVTVFQGSKVFGRRCQVWQ